MTRREARAAREALEAGRRSQRKPVVPAVRQEPSRAAERPERPGQQEQPRQQQERPQRDQHEHHEHPLGALGWHHHETQWGGDGGDGPSGPRRRAPGRARRVWTRIIVTVVVLALIGGGGWYAWQTFQPQVQSVMKLLHPEPTDYTGKGTGEVKVTIKNGDSGETIAKTLANAGVTKTSQAFYSLLLQTKPDPVFQPGVYKLRKHMSAKAALALLQDPKSHLANALLVREGETEATVLADAAAATKIPLAELKAAAKDPQAYGLPAKATSLEGFLFPATYTLDPDSDAKGVITTLVDRAKEAFAEDGIPSSKLWDTVILASIVQKEAGPNPQDLPKIAGVFQNRLDKGMPLQSDATVAYGTGHTDTVWTTDAERKNAKNPYNTYVHKGLPVGPISNPGDAALRAAMNPQGDYLYFTVVNLRTGETAFATTEAQHEKNVKQLQDWCAQSENKDYCS